MKKVLILGVGAQGSTIAKRLNSENNISEIRCADHDPQALSETASLEKAKCYTIDARRLEEIVNVAKGVDLIINALPPDFNTKVMDAALEVDCYYQDMASGPVSGVDFVEAMQRCLERGPEFEEKGLIALINTGSAPGFTNILARDSVDLLDSCEAIEILIYDGIWSKQFIPFWWSPKTAFGDMAAEPVRYENGRFIRTRPFDNPAMEELKGIGKRRMVDHEHEEPVSMGLLAGKALKGVKYVNFRYGGPAVELAENLYRMGLLSKEEIKINGTNVVPMEVVSALTPPAPKYPEEIKSVLDAGMELEEAAFLVRIQGIKEGQAVAIENYVNSPGLTNSFEIAQITHESYFTGQSAALFTKLLINKIITRKGAFPPEMLEKGERQYYLREAGKLGITVDRVITTRLY